MRRRFNIAGEFLNNGPNVENFTNAASAVFGGYDPQNPDLNIGVVDPTFLPGGSAGKLKLGEVGFADQLEKAILNRTGGVKPRLARTAEITPKGFISGNEVTPNASQVMPTEHGLSVVKVRPSTTPQNYVSNLAEKWASEVWQAENPTIAWMAGNTKLPPGRPKLKDITYPKNPETTTTQQPAKRTKTLTKQEQQQRANHETYVDKQQNPQTKKQKAEHKHTSYVAGKSDGRIASGRNAAQERRIGDTLTKWESNRRQGVDSNNHYQKEYDKLFKLKAKAESRGNHTLAKSYQDQIRKLAKQKHSDDDNGILNKD